MTGFRDCYQTSMEEIELKAPRKMARVLITRGDVGLIHAAGAGAPSEVAGNKITLKAQILRERKAELRLNFAFSPTIYLS